MGILTNILILQVAVCHTANWIASLYSNSYRGGIVLFTIMFHVRGEEHFDSTSADTFGFSLWRRFLTLTEAQPNTLEREIKTFIWTNYVPNGPKEKKAFSMNYAWQGRKKSQFPARRRGGEGCASICSCWVEGERCARA